MAFWNVEISRIPGIPGKVASLGGVTRQKSCLLLSQCLLTPHSRVHTRHRTCSAGTACGPQVFLRLLTIMDGDVTYLHTVEQGPPSTLEMDHIKVTGTTNLFLHVCVFRWGKQGNCATILSLSYCTDLVYGSVHMGNMETHTDMKWLQAARPCQPVSLHYRMGNVLSNILILWNIKKQTGATHSRVLYWSTHNYWPQL